MPTGFFKPGELGAAKRTLSVLREPACSACGLYRQCASPKMPFRGEGRKGTLVIGEAPGGDEDYQNKPFVGKSGQRLQFALRRAGVELSRDCWVTNALRCRPKGNKLPKDPKTLVEYCRPNVLREIRDLRPRVIILLGSVAVQSVVGWLWREDSQGMGRWASWQIPCTQTNAWICPTWHPAYVERETKSRRNQETLIEALFQRDIDAACALAEGGERPHPEERIDYASRVDCVMDPAVARSRIDAMKRTGLPLSFDFETDRLKPDHPDARVICCAVSDGDRAVSYPWQGDAVQATRELLLGDTPKIGYHAKFEDRWCLKLFGEQVRNFVFDGMLAAHVLDSRRGTKSLKFQAFVRLGVESYDDNVKPYLKSDTSNTPNRIGELSLKRVLQYCGMDALLEHRLATVLAKGLGVQL